MGSKSKIESLYDLKQGDHISVPGDRARVSGLHLYRHHMIVVEVISRKKLRVIHYSKTAYGDRATITEEVIEVDPYNNVIYRVNYESDKSYSGQEAIDRALERADECSYSLIFNNCESFCTWVKVNKNKSSQAEVGLAAGAAAVGVAVVGTVALFSIAVFKAFKSANKSSE